MAQICFTPGNQSTEVPKLGAWSSSLSMCTVERVISRGGFAQCRLLAVTLLPTYPFSPRGHVGCTDLGTQADVVGR